MAALHFNYNVQRCSKIDDKGESKLTVTYPKYKHGEGRVKETKTPPNFGKQFGSLSAHRFVSFWECYLVTYIDDNINYAKGLSNSK